MANRRVVLWEKGARVRYNYKSRQNPFAVRICWRGVWSGKSYPVERCLTLLVRGVFTLLWGCLTPWVRSVFYPSLGGVAPPPRGRGCILPYLEVCLTPWDRTGVYFPLRRGGLTLGFGVSEPLGQGCIVQGCAPHSFAFF